MPKCPQSKIAFVVTSPLTLNAFLGHHIRSLSSQFRVTVLTDYRQLPQVVTLGGAKLVQLPIYRKIHVLRDLVSVIALAKFLRLENFATTISVGPKAGLVHSIASWFCPSKSRIHWFTGQVWARKRGPARWFLKVIDRIISKSMTDCLVDGHSQKRFLVENRIGGSDSLHILLNGSISGVDTRRFKFRLAHRLEFRAHLDLPLEQVVAIFIGRITREKGAVDFALAAAELEEPLHTIWVGPDEERLTDQILATAVGSNARHHFVGHVSNPEYYLSAADFLVLPSYREGFGTSVIEAACAGLPAIVSKIYGLHDSVVDGVTGIKVKLGSQIEMVAAIELMMYSKGVRNRLGISARRRATRLYSHNLITNEFHQFVSIRTSSPEKFC